MSEPTDVEGLVEELTAKAWQSTSRRNRAGALPRHSDHVCWRAAAALSTLSTQLEEARRDARARSQPGYGECALASADAEPSGAWRPIESAPRDGTVIDVWADGARRANVFWQSPYKGWARREWRSRHLVTVVFTELAATHWQPLPSPPPALLKEPSHG